MIAKKSNLLRVFGCLALVNGAAWADGLPEGYVALDYVRPHGGCYQSVDTEYAPVGTDRIEMSCDFNLITRNCALWSGRGSNYENAIDLFNDGAGNFTVDCGKNSEGGRTMVSYAISTGVAYTFVEDCKAKKFIVLKDGVEDLSTDINKGLVDDAVCGSSLVLFGARIGTAPVDSLQAMDSYNVRSFRILDADGVVKVDMRPAFETSSCRAGFYDLVRNKFLFIDTRVPGTNKNLFFRADDAFGGGLPPGYERVERVASLQDRIVRIFFRPADTDTIEAKVKFNDLDQTAAIWCSREGYSTDSISLFYVADKESSLTIDCGTSADRKTPKVTFDEKTVYTLTEDCNARTFSINGEKLVDLGTQRFGQGGGWLSLFAANQGGTAYTVSSFSNGSYFLYSFSVKDADGNEKLNLVPCRETWSGLVGLYDLVGGSLYAASFGSACANTLETDPEINSLPTEYRRAKWVRAPGEQWVNTLFTPRLGDRIEMKVRFHDFTSGATIPLWASRVNYTDGINCILSTSDGKPTTLALCDGKGKNLDPAPDVAFLRTGVDYTLAQDGSLGRFTVTDRKGTTTVATWSPKFWPDENAAAALTVFAARLNYVATTFSKGSYSVSSVRALTRKGGVLRMDLVPCVKKSDKTVGFYDLISDQFLPFSAAGAEYELAGGTFIFVK